MSPTDARMPLLDHLRELRKRVTFSVLAIIVFGVMGWFLYVPTIDFLAKPLCNLSSSASMNSCDVLYINGVLGPLNLQIKVALMIGIVLASPFWLYHLWAFLAPGLHKKEKKWTIIFTLAATPLFGVGAFLGYSILPVAIRVLMGFTPTSLNNLIKFDDYLDFVTRLILVFGLSFELPLVLVALSLVGILSSRRMLSWWRISLFLIVLFTAAFTPTGDPITMLVLALPLVALYFLAILIAWLIERKRRKS